MNKCKQWVWLCKYIVLTILIFGMNSSFAKDADLSELLQRPNQLKKEMDACGFLKENKKSGVSLERCQKVEAVAVQFSKLVEAQRNNPEKFGEKIMQLENECTQHPNSKACETAKQYLAVVSLESPG